LSQTLFCTGLFAAVVLLRTNFGQVFAARPTLVSGTAPKISNAIDDYGELVADVSYFFSLLLSLTLFMVVCAPNSLHTTHDCSATPGTKEPGW
jgi:hypothetical protein